MIFSVCIIYIYILESQILIKDKPCKGNLNENFLGCGMGHMITTDFSEKPLSNVCPQIEDSLFAALYILRPINVL